jgi:hypothetical protein
MRTNASTPTVPAAPNCLTEGSVSALYWDDSYSLRHDRLTRIPGSVPYVSSAVDPRMRASGRQCRPTGAPLDWSLCVVRAFERLTSIPVPAAVGRLNCQSMRSSRVYTDHSPMSTQRRSVLDCRAAAMTCSVRKPSVNVGRSG